MPRGASFLSLEGRRLPGIRQLVAVPQPAVATDWTAVVPGGQEWRILTCRARLVTDATAGNRQPELTFTSQDGTAFWRSGWASAIPASLTVQVFGAVYSAPVTAIAAGSDSQIVLPPVWLPAGYRFGTTVNAVGAADQWSSIVLFVEQLYSTDETLRKE